MNEGVEVKKKPSRFWYLVPILFGIIGGLIGYMAVKNEDKEFAKRLLIVGIVISLFYLVARELTLMWFQSIYTEVETTPMLSLFTAWCTDNITANAGDDINIMLKNTGNSMISPSDIVVAHTAGVCQYDVVGKEIGVGEIVTLFGLNCTERYTHEYSVTVLKGAGFSTSIVVLCP